MTSKEDKTAEQLSELMRGLEIGPAAIVHLGPEGFYKLGKAIADQAKANTRADSGEAVAVGRLIIDLSRWQVIGFHDEISRLPLPAGEYDLFTQPFAMAADMRDAKRYRFLRGEGCDFEDEGFFYRHEMLDDLVDAAIASREGE